LIQATRNSGLRNLSIQATRASSGDLLTEDKPAEEDPETCEIVQGTNVTLGEGGEAVQAYFIQALKNNNGVGVLCLTDQYGFEDEENRGFAYRLACFGYKYATHLYSISNKRSQFIKSNLKLAYCRLCKFTFLELLIVAVFEPILN
jgi:hypothetical protein